MPPIAADSSPPTTTPVPKGSGFKGRKGLNPRCRCQLRVVKAHKGLGAALLDFTAFLLPPESTTS